jgi:hypothetical protein
VGAVVALVLGSAIVTVQQFHRSKARVVADGIFDALCAGLKDGNYDLWVLLGCGQSGNGGDGKAS